MDNAKSQQQFFGNETLYVEPGTRQCRILAIRGKLRPGQSLEAVLATQPLREVGVLQDGRIVSLHNNYWPTVDETQLTPGQVLYVKPIPSAVPQFA